MPLSRVNRNRLTIVNRNHLRYEEPEKAGELSALRELVKSAPCGDLTWGDDGLIASVNQALLRWAWHRCDALGGTRLPEPLPVEDRVLWATSCVPHLRAIGSVAEVVLEVLTAAGSQRAVFIGVAWYAAGGGAAPKGKVVVFGVHEWPQHQRSLMDTLHRAWESDQRRACAEAQARRLKVHDPLTGSSNRRCFLDSLETARREGQRAPMAVLVIDIDHFKNVNDSSERAAVDDLLSVVARRVSAIVGATCGRLERLSGDEIAVRTQVAGDDDGAALVKRLLEALGEPTTLDEQEIVVSAAIRDTRVTSGENI